MERPDATPKLFKIIDAVCESRMSHDFYRPDENGYSIYLFDDSGT